MVLEPEQINRLVRERMDYSINDTRTIGYPHGKKF